MWDHGVGATVNDQRAAGHLRCVGRGVHERQTRLQRIERLFAKAVVVGGCNDAREEGVSEMSWKRLGKSPSGVRRGVAVGPRQSRKPQPLGAKPLSLALCVRQSVDEIREHDRTIEGIDCGLFATTQGEHDGVAPVGVSSEQHKAPDASRTARAYADGGQRPDRYSEHTRQRAGGVVGLLHRHAQSRIGVVDQIRVHGQRTEGRKHRRSDVKACVRQDACEPIEPRFERTHVVQPVQDKIGADRRAGWVGVDPQLNVVGAYASPNNARRLLVLPPRTEPVDQSSDRPRCPDHEKMIPSFHMGGFAEYDRYDAMGLAELVKQRQVSASELVHEAIARAERVNPALNAITHCLYESAEALGSTPAAGPFSGVPFALKDLIQSYPGLPVENGSRFWKGYVADSETTLMKRWLATGVVPVVKTATPELGILPVAECELNGPTVNPWATDRTCGGSSGGSGALVAARVVPMATGGDGGGSIRIPASCCGVFGLKPTRGRTPAGPYLSENWAGFVSEHVLTVSVRDSAAMLDATHGPEATSPYHAPAVDESFLSATTTDPGKLKIAYYTDPVMPATVHPDCIAAVHDAAQLCRDLGHDVVEHSMAHDSLKLARAFMTVIAANVAAEIKAGERVRNRKAKRGDFEMGTWLLKVLAEANNAATYVSCVKLLQSHAARLARYYADYDAVLTPTLASPPVLVGALQPRGVDRVLQSLITVTGFKAPLRSETLLEQAAADVFGFVPFTPVANFSGLPSMSVPLMWNEADLPVGAMFTGRFGEERTLLALAAQLERARPWQQRRPPTCA